MTRPVRAAVVGLGEVGSRFDEEPGRGAVWTHVGAYLAHPESFTLAGACEPVADNAAAFRERCPGVPVFATAAELAAETRPEVASVCTPAGTHRAVLDALLETPGLRVVWCEKPLADTLDDAAAMVEACERRGVALVVSHVRRWVPLWRRLRARVAEGEVGKVRCVRVAMPNRLLSIGSHAVDLALMLGGAASGDGGAEVRTIDIPALYEEGEPARAALIALEGGGYAIIQVTGRKSALVVEAEVIGDHGRLIAREDRGTLSFERFAPSGTYAGYRELGDAVVETLPTPAGFSPFVAIAAEAAALARGEVRRPTCGGAEALAVQRVLERMAAA